MLAYRFHSTLFTHVVVAQNYNSAIDVAQRGDIPLGAFDQWHTPDVWTRRAVDMAKAPGIIDTIPRFVVDRGDGSVYLDIDDVPAKLTPDECVKIDDDSVMHRAWVTACQAEREQGEVMCAWITHVASIQDHAQYATHARALAGAWGLGPIPEWHAAILPALIALDIEAPNRGYTLADNVFELDRDELWQHLHAQLPDTDDDINHLVELIARGTNLSLREYALRTLVSLGWFR